jgi:hypothetical protein
MGIDWHYFQKKRGKKCWARINRIMESSGLISFVEQSHIPPMRELQKAAAGMCGHNIDGRCIMGGRVSAGNSGYQLASMGFPGGGAGGGQHSVCQAFPLFLSFNRPYELYGIQLATNRNPLLTGATYI